MKNVVYCEINKSFAAISQKLFKHSLNYCANFQLYTSEAIDGESTANVVARMLGSDAVVGGCQAATIKEVSSVLADALRYRGDGGSHPSLDYLDSPDSRRDFDRVESAIKQILDNSIDIQSFWLKSGHPFYPVFWDFAFLMHIPGKAILFIASSSD